MNEKTDSRSHRIELFERKRGTITGVKDVMSFDTEQIILQVKDQMLCIKGKDLHVKRLTVESGEVEIEGMVNSMAYSEIHSLNKQGASLLGRMFK